MNTRDKRVERAQTRVIFTCPFFAPGVARLPVVWDETIPTACTDGQVIRWNPDWFDSLADSVLPTVLCHETCHCLLGHLWRAPEACDWDVWNQATDHAVNLMLGDFAKEVLGKGLADPFPFPEPKEAFCADPRFRGMAEEAIYTALGNRPKPQGQPQTPSGSGSGGQGGNKSALGQGKGQGKPAGGQSGPPQQQPQPGSMPSFGQIQKPNGKGKTPAQHKALQNDWANTLIQSAKVAQGQGTLPAGMERIVGELVHPHVPWWEILASWLRERATEDWDFSTPDLTFEDTGFLMPSLNSERVGSVAFATDTSGSIDGEMLTRFQSVKQDFLDNMRPKRLVDIYCDADIHKCEEYTPGDIIAKDAPGGGGTSFRPVFTRLEKLGQAEPFKALVYLTDLYGDFPDKAPEYPVIWVTWTKDGKAPFGEVIYVGE